jgi:endonuclease/exonuclease/phosphatase family metal-dependent hydrolase
VSFSDLGSGPVQQQQEFVGKKGGKPKEEAFHANLAAVLKGDRVWYNGQAGTVSLIYTDGTCRIRLDDGTTYKRVSFSDLGSGPAQQQQEFVGKKGGKPKEQQQRLVAPLGNQRSKGGKPKGLSIKEAAAKEARKEEDKARMYSAEGELQISPLTRLLPLQTQNTIRFASWNLKHLSEKTAKEKKAMVSVRRLVHEVDFLALQEIDDGAVVPKLIKQLGEVEWDFSQQKIVRDDDDARHCSEYYAFLWRKSAVVCLHTSSATNPKPTGYIVRDLDEQFAQRFFHRPPLIATFAAAGGGFVFTAVTIHLTYGGPSGWEPKGIAARLVETENLAALAHRIHDLHARSEKGRARVVDRVVMMGDFNLPARPNNFRSLLGDDLNYRPCLDPEVSPASMLSRATAGGEEDEEERVGKQKEVPGDMLFDNIIMSPPLDDDDLGVGGGHGGGEVAAQGVCNLVALIDDFDLPMLAGADMGERDTAQLLLSMKKLMVLKCISDHLPVWADITAGSGYSTGGGPRAMPKVKIGIVRFDAEGAEELAEEVSGEAVLWAKGDRIWFNGQEGIVTFLYQDTSYRVRLDDGTIHKQIHASSLSAGGSGQVRRRPNKVGIQYTSVKTHGAAAARRRAANIDTELAVAGKAAFTQAHNLRSAAA